MSKTRMRKVKFDRKKLRLRKARVLDIPALVSVENRCFSYDQLGRRNFHWMIKHGHSILLVLEYGTEIIGYGLVLINSATSLARLYSICTLKEFQGHGLGSYLLAELEAKAVEENCAFMRLEVKASNKGAISLYEKLGYRQFTVKKDYYDDGTAALCYEKQIKVFKARARLNVPYYQQRTDFTCGPSCLMMAMQAFDRKRKMSLSEELQIWREATTIFMTSGHGGCGPQGLAVAAITRGYKAELYLSHSDVLFLKTVRSDKKKEVITLVQEDFEKKLEEHKVPIHRKRLTLNDLKETLKKGGIPIVLISTYQLDKNRIPHWVVVTAYDEHFIYVHDPDQDADGEGSLVHKIHIPIPEEKFLKISRWGKDRISATVVLKKTTKK